MIPTVLPEHLDIDLSARCNLRCSFCHLSYFDPKDRGEQITLPAFERHFGSLLPSLKKLTLFSKFEALTARDFIPIFRRIAAHDIEIYFSTNGILLDDGVLDVLVGRLDFLTVSLTGFDRERYLRFMRQDAFARVQDNLQRLRARKQALGTERPRLRISTVGMQSTLEDLPRAIDFARAHEATEGVQLTSLYVFDPAQMAETPLADMDRYNRLTAEALAYADQRGVRLTLQSGTLEDNARETAALGHRSCFIPWQRVSVQPNGDVYPCPVAYQPVGNLNQQPLAEIWNGPALARFRAGVNDPERMNEDCRKCIHCRHHNITDPAANDFSAARSFVGGMVRKPTRIRRREEGDG